MNKKNLIQEIALQRIWRLFELAEAEFEGHPERSKRYVELARKISERNREKIPIELKKKFCKNCGAFLEKGKNSEEKIEKNLMVVKCLECGKERKINLEKIKEKN